MNSLRLEDEGIRLRCLTMADLDYFVTLANDNSVARWTTVPSPYTRLHATQWIAYVHACHASARPTALPMAIADRKTNRIMGMMGAHAIRYDTRRCDVGYWMGRPFRGRGRVRAAARILIPYLFERFALERIEIFCAPGNHASCRIAESLGARHMGMHLRHCCSGLGEWLDAKVYVLTPALWKPDDGYPDSTSENARPGCSRTSLQTFSRPTASTPSIMR